MGFFARRIRIEHLLIRSCWKGVKIGEARTLVFVLLVPDVFVVETRRVSSKDFIHAFLWCGVASVRLPDGTIRLAEVHWYEAHDIGKKEFKLKLPFLD
jgi:hypothetical protein